MNQHSPTHPGKFIQRVYLNPFNLGADDVARKLDICPILFNQLIIGEIEVNASIALRLSKVFGRSPESWLLMQSNFSLNEAEKTEDLSLCQKIHFH